MTTPSTHFWMSGAYAMWRRGLASLTTRAALLGIPAGIVVCTCYLLIFLPATRATASPLNTTTLGAGLVTLMALSASFTDAMDTLYARLHISRLYIHALAQTPLSPGALIGGDVATALTRSLLYVAGADLLLLSVLHTPLPLTALWTLAGLATALMLAALNLAICSWVRSLNALNTVRFALLPMFLFSGAVFPLDGFPGWLQHAAACLPVWQAASFLRALATGQWAAAALAGLYLVLLTAACLAVTHHQLRTLTEGP